jgi:peroxiredoxin
MNVACCARWLLIAGLIAALAACSRPPRDEWEDVLAASHAAEAAVDELRHAKESGGSVDSRATESVIRACLEAARLAKDHALRAPEGEHREQAIEIFISRQGVLQQYGRADRAGAEELLKLPNLSPWTRENLVSTGILERQKELATLWKGDRASANAALRAQIASVAESYPQGGLAVVLADRMADLLSESEPETITAFWREMAQSPAQRLRTHAASRLALQDATRVPMDLAFTAIDGREVDLKQLRGKVVLLAFTGVTWCAPCREEEKDLKELYSQHGRDELEIVAISWEYTPSARDKVASLLRERQIPWPYYFDGNGQENPFIARFGIRAVPNTFLLDRTGLLVASGLEGERLTARTNALLLRGQ